MKCICEGQAYDVDIIRTTNSSPERCFDLRDN